MRRTLLALIGLAGLVVSLAPSEAQRPRDVFQLIVHADNPVLRASRLDVSRLFLKKVTRWEDGTAVVPVDLPGDSAVRDGFSVRVHERATYHIENYWHRLFFSGRDTPPATLKDDEEVVEFVRSTPGAVGYVSTAARLEGVKVLLLTEEP